MITIIAAMDLDGVIGNQGHMPWHDHQELALFRSLTMGHKLFMGRTTWESLPNPLEDRQIMIVSHHNDLLCKHGEIICQDPISILRKYQNTKEMIMVGGGRKVYEMALPYADTLYLSIMKQRYHGDTTFPEWKKTDYICIETRDYPTFTWYSYKRKKGTLCDL